jgi:hypothetical protein
MVIEGAAVRVRCHWGHGIFTEKMKPKISNRKKGPTHFNQSRCVQHDVYLPLAMYIRCRHRPKKVIEVTMVEMSEVEDAKEEKKDREMKHDSHKR